LILRQHLDPGPAEAVAPVRPRPLASDPGRRAQRQPRPARPRPGPRRRDRDLSRRRGAPRAASGRTAPSTAPRP